MSSVLAIDFGNANHVISAPRKGGVDILDKSSQRQIPSIVAFSEIRRYSGINAQHQHTMNLKSTVTNLKKMIGLKYDTKEREELEKHVTFALKKLDDGYIGVEVKYLNKKTVLRVEQCVALLIENSFQIANEHEIHSSDCVIVVPPFWNEYQRRSVLLSAQIAGFNVLRLLNSTTAAAIAYSMYQRKKLPDASEKNVNVAFIDFGESQLCVSIAMMKKGSVEVKGFAFDDLLGGKNFTDELVKLLLEKTKQKYNLDPTSNHRQMLRFIQAAEKVKKNFAVNRAVSFDIQNFTNGIDINFVVKREEFESRVTHLVKRVEVTILKALELADVKKEDIFAIEFHGGCSRVKIVRDMVREVFGKEFTQSFNPDEIFSIGAGFQAAILSSQYKVDLSVKDVSPYKIMYEYEDENGVKNTDELFKQFEQLPSKKTVRINVNKKCKIHFLNDERSCDLGNVEIQTGNDDKTTVDLTVCLSENGIFQVIDASSNDKNVKFSFKPCYEFSIKDIDRFIEEENNMKKHDEDEAAIDKARDQLRDYIFTMYTYIKCDFPGFDPSKKIEYLLKTLEVQEWFEDNELTRLSIEDYKNKIDILKAFGEPAIERKNAHVEIPNKILELIDSAEIEKKKLDNKDEKFSHITEEEREEIRKEINEYIDWMKNQNDELKKLPQYVDIPFNICDAQSKLAEIEKKVIDLFMKPKITDLPKKVDQQDTADQK